MNVLVSRTDAEARIYLGLQRCPHCGQAETSWEYAGRFYEDSPAGEVILDKYRGTCESGRHTRFAEFTVLQPDEPADTAFGGATPSQLLDAGQWVGVASFLAKLPADSETPELKHVEWARDAYLEAMKFIPPGADAVPADSLHSDQGRETAAGNPLCLTRAWLQDHADETAAWARRLPPGEGRPGASRPVTAPPKPALAHVGDGEQHREPPVPDAVDHAPPRRLVSPPVPRAGPDRSWLQELRGKLIAELLDVAAEVYPGAKPALERDTGVAARGSERFTMTVIVSAAPAGAAGGDAAGALQRAAALLKARDWVYERPSDTELRVRQRWLGAIAWVTADRGTGKLRLSAEAGYLTRFTVLPSPARTLAEAKLYLEYHLECRACGDIALRQRGIATREVGNRLEHDLITRCGRCGDDDEHAFWLPREQRWRPGPGFGGQERSQLLDPGDWLLVARKVHAVVPYEYKRRRDASSRDYYRDRLQLAVTAVGEAMKFLDPGAATVAPGAFFSPKGRELFTANPALFRRDRLAEQQAAYEKQLTQYSGRGHRR